jgi:hypothetical protein
MRSFLFLDDHLQKRLVSRVRAQGVQHRIGKNGALYYARALEDAVGNNVICSIRSQVFESWQILSCPKDWIARYKHYMEAHAVPFKEEMSNGEHWFLLPRRYRPHQWKL